MSTPFLPLPHNAPLTVLLDFSGNEMLFQELHCRHDREKPPSFKGAFFRIRTADFPQCASALRRCGFGTTVQCARSGVSVSTVAILENIGIVLI